VQIELLHDPGAVRFDGAEADEEQRRDFLVGLPFGDELENSVRGRLVNGRPIVVKIIDRLENLYANGSAHVLFVEAKEERLLEGSLDSLRRANILTVGETRKFAAMGGVITFVLSEDKVRFEINRTAGEQAGLKINAQLLKLALPARNNP